jgi:hypothetical protein
VPYQYYGNIQRAMSASNLPLMVMYVNTEEEKPVRKYKFKL